MDLISIVLIAIALAMDAFSISVTKGFSLKNITTMESLWFGIFFGGFQMFMPVLGWLAGIELQYLVSTIAPWIAFMLLLFIGLKMIYESINEDNFDELENQMKNKFSFKELTILSVATSIDAFAVGVTFALLNIAILIPIIIIGVASFIFSEIGILLGKKVGKFLGDKFEIVGGVVLILLGVKILIEGIGII